MSAGKATPLCADRVQILAVTDTQLGSSKVPLDIQRIPGLLSKLSVTVVPQLPQKWMCACLLPSSVGWLYRLSGSPENATASSGNIDSTLHDDPVTFWQNVQ